jgi:hypothetical protein
MIDNTISVDPDAARQNALAISRHISELPSGAEVGHHQGPAVGVTANFHSALTGAATILPSAVEELRSLLQSSQDAIEKTVAGLLAQDETMADEAKAMLAGIADVTASTTTPASHAAAPATATSPADVSGWG